VQKLCKPRRGIAECHPADAQLGQRCNPADLAKLQTALGAVSEPTFAYDKEYICEFMGWSQAPSAVAPTQ